MTDFRMHEKIRNQDKKKLNFPSCRNPRSETLQRSKAAKLQQLFLNFMKINVGVGDGKNALQLLNS